MRIYIARKKDYKKFKKGDKPMRKHAVIQKTNSADYPYVVDQYTSFDKEAWHYCGKSKFCKTSREAKREKRRIERR